MNDPGRSCALVTGASSGLGWHLSELLVQKGYQLIAVSNETVALNQLRQYLEEKYARQIVMVEMDLASDSAARSLFAYCEERNLHVEVLVNNAGMLVYGEAIHAQHPDVQSLMQLHMNTPGLLCHLFSEKMVKQGRGFILNVASISAVMPYPTISFYGPSKTFLRYFTRAIRTELMVHGVHVTCLLPGPMDTNLLDAYHINRRLGLTFGILKRPEQVARSGLRALFRNLPECIPGFVNKLVIWFVPLVPHSFILLIYKRSRKVT
jgi:short-subunit dehydrogenase